MADIIERNLKPEELDIEAAFARLEHVKDRTTADCICTIRRFIVHAWDRKWHDRGDITLTQARQLMSYLPDLRQARSFTGVHEAIALAGGIVKDQALQAEPGSIKQKAYYGLMRMAGDVCLSTPRGVCRDDRRAQEFDLFRPFLGETARFKAAEAKYKHYHSFRNRVPSDLGLEPIMVETRHPVGIKRGVNMRDERE